MVGNEVKEPPHCINGETEAVSEGEMSTILKVPTLFSYLLIILWLTSNLSVLRGLGQPPPTWSLGNPRKRLH